MQVITTYIIVQELQFCMEIGFLPRRISSLTLSVPHNYVHVHVHVRTLVQVVLEEANTHSGTIGFAPEMYNKPQLFR